MLNKWKQSSSQQHKNLKCFLSRNTILWNSQSQTLNWVRWKKKKLELLGCTNNSYLTKMILCGAWYLMICLSGVVEVLTTILWRGNCYSHLTEDKIVSERWWSLSEVTCLINAWVGIWNQVWLACSVPQTKPPHTNQTLEKCPCRASTACVVT